MRKPAGLRRAIITGCCLALSISFATAAKRDRDWDACNGSDNDASIIGCTNVLNRGDRESRADQATAYNNRGWSYSEKGDHDRAIADYDEAIKLDPKLALAFVNRGWSFERKGEYDRAIADYDEAIRLDRNYSLAYNNRGWAYHLKGDYDRAIADYVEAIRTDPKDPYAYVNRCDAYVRKGDYEHALPDCQAAIRLDRNNAFAYGVRGNLYYQEGEYDRALRDYDKAIGLEPKLGWARAYRGLAYEKKGDLARARADFAAALAIRPEDGFEKEAHDLARAGLASLQGPPARETHSSPAASFPAVAEPSAAAAPASTTREPPAAQPTPPEAASAADRRVALVIGNAAYAGDDQPLSQPLKDAQTIVEELSGDGFDVIAGENVTRLKFNSLLSNFGSRIRPGATGLFFFSGYGIQSGKQSYLIPVDAQIWTEADVKNDGVTIESILTEMNRAGAAVKLVIIDAARRNPFERRFRGMSTGLAPLTAPAGTLAIYSAAPDKANNDSEGENSLFLSELLKQMRTPGLSALAIFNATQKDVSRASNNEQLPWVSSSLVDEFSFKKPPRSPSANSPSAPPSTTSSPAAPAETSASPR